MIWGKSQADYDKLEKQCRQAMNEASRLQDEVRNLQEKVRSLEETKTILKQENSEFRGRNNYLVEQLFVMSGSQADNNRTGKASINNESADSSLFKFLEAENACELVKYIGFGEDVSLRIPDSYNNKPVISIGNEAFSHLGKLQRVVIGSNVKWIGNSAFAFCRELREVILGQNVRYIAQEAFANCSSLRDSVLPDSVLGLGDKCFSRAGIKNIRLSNNIRILPTEVFSHCRELEQINLSDSIEIIEEKAFNGCTALKRINFGSGLRTIKHNAFVDCLELKQIDLPPSVKEIDDANFYATQSGSGIQYNSKTIRKHINMTIYCTPGSTAQEFARKNGFMMKMSGRIWQHNKVTRPAYYVYTPDFMLTHPWKTVYKSKIYEKEREYISVDKDHIISTEKLSEQNNGLNGPSGYYYEIII